MEQLIKKASAIGNGAHIFVPKEWVGQEVVIVKSPLKEELIKILSPYLEHIIGVYLYGSYARGEQTEESDIDVLVIADKKFKIREKGRFDIIVINKEIIDEAPKINPILWFSMLRDAKPIINEALLFEMQKKSIDIKLFQDFIKSTKESQKSNKELIELDKKTKDVSSAVIYSLILRLRGIFLINKLLNNQKFNNELFRKWLINKTKIDFNKVYKIYRAVRDDKKKIKIKITLEEEEKLYNLLESEIKKLEKKR